MQMRRNVALLKRFFQVLHDTHEEQREIAQYYFSGEGKAVRPVIILCMASAINNHLQQTSP